MKERGAGEEDMSVRYVPVCAHGNPFVQVYSRAELSLSTRRGPGRVARARGRETRVRVRAAACGTPTLAAYAPKSAYGPTHAPCRVRARGRARPARIVERRNLDETGRSKL